MTFKVVSGKQGKVKIAEGDSFSDIVEKVSENAGKKMSLDDIVIRNGYATYQDGSTEVVVIDNSDIVNIPKVKALVKAKMKNPTPKFELTIIEGKQKR